MDRTAVSSIVFLLLFTLTLAIGLTVTASPIPNLTPTPTPTEIFSRYDYFPDGLACAYAETGLGPRIGDIRIGRSTLDDFLSVYEVYDIEISYIAENHAYVVMRHELTLPFALEMCFVDNVIVVINGVLPSPQPQPPIEVTFQPARPLTIQHYVDANREPDVVTYTLSPAHRVAFWFEDGLAVVIWVGQDDETTILGGFGTINQFIYFPYQDVDDYESRWPYSRTYPEWIYTSDERITSERNPFGFDSMPLTSTASPRYTPTPTP